jgi:hypothetical protein
MQGAQPKNLHDLGYTQLEYTWYYSIEMVSVTSQITKDDNLGHIINVFKDQTYRMTLGPRGLSPRDKPRDGNVKYNQNMYDICTRLDYILDDMGFDKFKNELDNFAYLYRSEEFDKNLIKFSYSFT